MSFGLAALLVIIALIGGICITTIGPGGIFVTIALFTLANLDPSTVAGTASVTFVATGLVGGLAYLRSGELKTPGAKRASIYLSAASVLGAFGGSQLNTVLDARLFGILLGLFVLMTGVLIVARLRGLLSAKLNLKLDEPGGGVAIGVVGLVVGFFGGLLGVGGPVLAVPLLVILGVPMLISVALAQVQSIFISLFASAGFYIHDAIDWNIALLVGVPLLVGTLAGWVIARRTNPQRLQLGLAVVLLALGVYLLFGGGPPT